MRSGDSQETICHNAKALASYTRTNYKWRKENENNKF